MTDLPDEQRRSVRSAKRLGWLVGPAIVIATMLVASGCDSLFVTEMQAPATASPVVSPAPPEAS